MKKAASILLILLLVFSLSVPAFAAGNVQYFSGVTEAMCQPEYWAKKTADPNRVLMTPAQIDGYNKAAAAEPTTNRVDLYAVDRTYDATALLSSLVTGTENEKPARDLYVDGSQLDKDAFYQELISAMRSSALYGTQQFRYAICTAHTGIYAIPTDIFIGYSATDPDCEFQLSELRVNEPFLIKQTCTYNGKTFYWGMSSHLSGWVDANHLAICSDRNTWKDAFAVNTAAKDFIVVTADQIYTEPSRTVPSTSRVRLTIGTVLKLVENDQIPQNIGERNAWNSYVVYLPTRSADGTYHKQMALIPQHADVSVGYLPLTQANLLKIAFSCLGNCYGWAGTLGAMDCSLYTRAVYRCFGLDLPRNTNWQQNVPKTRIDLSGMTDEQKLALFAKLPVGTQLFISGHTMLYIGMENNMAYVISDTGSVSQPEGEVQVESTYSVIINPLSARRRNGNSWLTELVAAVVPAEYNGHALKTSVTKATPKKAGARVTACTICGTEISRTAIAAPKSIRLSADSFVYTGKAITPKIKVVDSNGKTIDLKYYSVKYANNKKLGTAKITVTFKGDYAGTLSKKFRIVPKGTAIMSVQTSDKRMIVTWKKQAKQTDGYELMYAKNAKFNKGVKTVRISDPAQTYITIDNFKGKTCYMRIRTYQIVDKHRVYSDWSKTTKVKRA